MSKQDRKAFATLQPYISLVLRLAAGVIMIWAGLAKVGDLPQSVRATRAYELLPEAIVPFVGNALPFVEIVLGFFLIFGLATRLSAWVYTAMIVAFIIGISWAWAKGLTIDCGCFGGGGQVTEAETDYPGHMRDRVLYLALGVWLVIWPRSAVSIDGFLMRNRPTLAGARKR